VRRLLTWRWILVHLGMVALVIGFLALGWWQIDRARGGNPLSLGYAIEWPAFAAFVVYVWLKEVRQCLEKVRQEGHRPPPGGQPAADAPEPVRRPVIRASVRHNQRNAAAYDDSGDADLAAYNRYLAWLNANPHTSPSQYPGQPRT
jgi:hypothetical protein